MTTQVFRITGMTCAACSARVEKAASGVPGVSSAAVNLLKNSMRLEYDGVPETLSAVCTAVEKAGYGAQALEVAVKQTALQGKGPQAATGTALQDARQMRMRLAVSFIFAIPLFYLSMGHMLGWPLPGCFLGHESMMTLTLTEFLLLLPILAVNYRYFTVGFTALLHGAPTMDTLVALGSAASTLYSVAGMYRMGSALGGGNMDAAHAAMMDLYFEGAGVILALITLGKYFEARAKSRTTDAVAGLMDLAPKTARRMSESGVFEEVDASSLQVGDVLEVRSGDAIPADGIVCEGSAAVDESALTGESVPVDKSAGDAVTGASLCTSGYFTMEACKVGQDTALAQIIALVDSATGTKPPIQRIADKISAVFVPAVIAAAALVFAVWVVIGGGIGQAVNHAISVLVVSCPCAMGLATPTAIMVGMGRGAKRGILIKDALALENAHDIRTVVLDKTGTITQGAPHVTDAIAADGVAEGELLMLAYAIEAKSEHPLGRALCEYASNRGVERLAVQDFTQVQGRGLRARFAGAEVLAGNRAFMADCGIGIGSFEEQADKLAEAGKTPLFFAYGGRFAGMFALADVVKSNSAHAVAKLKDMGIGTVMLTGDNQVTARAVAAQVEVDRVLAGVKPQDKEAEIRKLQQRGKVAMVGDGINDAPALARADVGIAIGAGTDIAMESADMVLIRSDLEDVPAAISLSRATLRNIKQNLFWALIYNVICIPIAAGVLAPVGISLNPMIAAAAMSCSSICVVCNALRLSRWKG
ncbi:MAG: heavy metal translocating P-type ATPase [Eggerthellaceae bacterium]